MVVVMGSAAETAHRDGRMARGARREGGRAQGAPLSTVLGRGFPERAANDRSRDRRARPDQGTGRARRAALPGRRDGIPRGPAGGRAPVRARARGRRRALRAVVEGVHARPWSKAVFDELAPSTRSTHFTVGIVDDVTHLSLAVDADVRHRARRTTVRAVFFGLGADGTVGANKNSIKIIGEETPTVRAGLLRLRLEEVGRDDDLAPALRPAADPVCLLIRAREFRRLPPVPVPRPLRRARHAAPGATFLLNTPHAPEEVWDRSPAEVQGQIIDEEAPLLRRSTRRRSPRRPAWAGGSTRSCRPASSRSRACSRADEAIEQIKEAIEKTYGKSGEEVVKRNFAAVDAALAHLHEVPRPSERHGRRARMPPIVSDAGARLRQARHRGHARRQGRPAAGQRVPGRRHAGRIGTARWEKRDIAVEIPLWDPAICIQCNKCVLVCPHAAIRAKVYRRRQHSAGAPADVQVRRFRSRRTKRKGCATRSRSRPRTAPAATSASRSARRRTRPIRGTRRSTWSPRRRSAKHERAN